MTSSARLLSAGYSAVPPGMIATVVTCLEMTQRPRPRPLRPVDTPMVLQRVEKPDLQAYRALFRAVGQDWLWYSRLTMPDDELRGILEDPLVEIHVLSSMRRDIGLLELDFRRPGECELAFFGLVKEAIGQGAGRFLMDQALAKAWSRPIERLWVHTCTFDHPAALGFYRRSGFVPFSFEVEVSPDPRLSGHLPREVAPQVPLADFGP
ncbi:GNAT family N-acetyltransferase [Labrys monachus]|uniref:GNAT superfamily N-acetyltransferase n=1 Tax=Labrys monachus TaxID=217067 RepID=A0ABU0F9I2_9HYPH|nr:GNAT family N-acetyltransferase [Labrys monachus]MDQ0391264.1 GNAT superfamily N-acetyltransferase [Labrys monachus]